MSNARTFNRTNSRATMLRGDSAIYLYYGNGERVEIATRALCPDCTTPTVWIDEDENDKPYVAEVYHDKTCIAVAEKRGKVAPTREEQERGRR